MVRIAAVDLAYDPALVENRTVTCSCASPTPEALLHCVLAGSDLRPERLPSGMYVLAPAPVEVVPLIRLTGLVVDADTDAPLPYAHVRFGEAVAVTNQAGRFLLSAQPAGTYDLTVSYVGYRTYRTALPLTTDAAAPVQVGLTPEPVTIAPVIVDASQHSLRSEQLVRASVTPAEEQPAGTLGAGVTAALGTLMGVQVHDATAGLHVQGGESGEHQFRLDGVPVFVPGNLGTLIGPFSPFAIRQMTVHKAGFGVVEGSQISGAITARHDLSVRPEHTADVQVDPLSLNAHLDGLRWRSRAVDMTTMATLRTSLWSVYAAPPIRTLLEDWNTTDTFMLAAFGAAEPSQADTSLLRLPPLGSTGDPSLSFHDVHAATRLRFSPLRSLYASTYWGWRTLSTDRPAVTATPGTLPGRDRYGWTTGTGVLRYEAVLNDRLMGHVQGWMSYYRLDHRYGFSADRLERLGDGNRINVYGTDAQVTWVPSDLAQWTAGTEIVFTDNRFDLNGTQTLPIDYNAAGWRVAGYAQQQIRLTAATRAELGVRLTWLPDRSQALPYVEPRLALRFDPEPGRLGAWSLRLGAGLYRQFVTQFDVGSRSARALLSSNRIWLLTDASVRPPLASHTAASILWQPHASWTVQAEGYYKHYLHLLAIDYAAVPEAGTAPAPEAVRFEQDDFLREGLGYAHGAALLVSKTWPTARAAVRYEYSFAERNVDALFSGFSPVSWSEPHRTEVRVHWTPQPALTLLGRWRGTWGRTWGFRRAYYDFFGAQVDDRWAAAVPRDLQPIIARHIDAYALDDPGRHRLPPMLQLDLGAAWVRPVGPAQVQVRLDLLNVLNRANVADWRFTADADAYRTTGLLPRSDRLLLPFTPSLAARVQW